MWIGYWYDIGIWFDSVEWKVCCFNIGFCQCVEQGGFFDVGQIDDIVFEFYDLIYFNILIINLLQKIDCRNGNNFVYYIWCVVKMLYIIGYCVLKVCKWFVVLVRFFLNYSFVQCVVLLIVLLINFCLEIGGLFSMKLIILFLLSG